MKRLTKKIDNGRFVTTDAEARSYGETDPEDGFFYNYFTGEAVDKLAAYENTGLEPADIEDLLAAMPHWISVEERLPKKDEMVIVYYSWTGQSGTVYKEVSLATLDEIRYCGSKLLGWMPLPEPPKEVE